MNFKIVADSSADLIKIGSGVPFESVPLKIITAQREYVDNEQLDAKKMAEELRRYKGKSRSSCPNPDEYLAAFGDADRIFCVTITSGLSGSCNAARAAAKEYEAQYPERRVFVVDTLSAGPECALIVEKISELIESGDDFDSICKRVEEYQQGTGLAFALESLHNLAANGRVNPIVAKLSGLLGIRVVGKASDKGTLEVVEKSRGRSAALSAVVRLMEREGYRGGKVRIHHSSNSEAADALRSLILGKHPEAPVTVGATGGLCSFYAELGGVLVGFERS